jgi:hypothetical protein
MTRFLGRALLLAWLALSAGSAFADDDTYAFTIHWQSGSLLGTSSTGSLSFDDSLAIANAVYVGPDVLRFFSLTIGSTFYGLASVTTGYLWFDASSDLRLLLVGTDCGPGFCSVSPTEPNTFYLTYDAQSQLDRFFAVTGPANVDQSHGVGSFQAAPVPEPSSLVLLLAGGGLLAWRRRATTRGAGRASG